MADLTSTLTNAINPVAAVGGIVLGGAQLFSSLHDEAQKKKELNGMANPFYTIQNEYYQNRNLAGANAESGMPAASKDYLTSESQRGLGAGVSGMLQSGGDPNNINKLFDSYNRNIDRTAADDASEHLKNIQYYISQNSNLAGQKNIQWALNKKQPYEEKLKQLTEGIAADKQNAVGGASTAIGSTAALGTSLENNTLLKSLFGNSGGGAGGGGGVLANVAQVAPVDSMAHLSGGSLAPMQMPTFNSGEGNDNTVDYFNNTQAG